MIKENRSRRFHILLFSLRGFIRKPDLVTTPQTYKETRSEPPQGVWKHYTLQKTKKGGVVVNKKDEKEEKQGGYKTTGLICSSGGKTEDISTDLICSSDTPVSSRSGASVAA